MSWRGQVGACAVVYVDGGGLRAGGITAGCGGAVCAVREYDGGAWAGKHMWGGAIAVYEHVEGAVHVGRKMYATHATRPPHVAYVAVARAEIAMAARACACARAHYNV